jgi:hypothetical protein
VSGHLSTGSGIQRFVACRASSVLPRSWAHTTYSDAGQDVHAHLERLAGGMDVAESLALVLPEHRQTCEDLDLAKLAAELAMAAEVTLAYHPGTDTARIVGQRLARDYSAVAADEVPMTLDLLGVDLDRRRGEVKDYKSGFARYVPPTSLNWQILGGALALARLYDLDTVEGELIFTRTGRRDRHEFSSSDFLLASDELRETHDRALRDREAHKRGEHVEPTEGPHCRYCPSFSFCPAKINLARAALAGEIAQPTREDAARALPRIRAARKLLEKIEEAIEEDARTSPIPLERADDGTVTYLGEVVGPGNEKLDPDKALATAAEVLNLEGEKLDAFRREVSPLDVTKSGLEDAIKKHVPKGKGAATIRRVYELLRGRGGAARPMRATVTTFTARPAAGDR